MEGGEGESLGIGGLVMWLLSVSWSERRKGQRRREEERKKRGIRSSCLIAI